MSLLDCGCGSGSITVGLAAAVAPGQAIGIDISEVKIARARKRAAQQGVSNLDPIVTTASQKLHTSPEQLRSLVEVFATRYGEPDFCQRVLSRGLVSMERLAAMQEAWRARPEHSGAFGANAYVEVVGWKAPARPGPGVSGCELTWPPDG